MRNCLGLLVALSLASIRATTSFFVHPAVAPLRRAAVPRLTISTALLAEEEWIANLDLEAFGSEVRALGRRLKSEEGDADLQHLRKIQRWNTAFMAVGLCTMALPVNPVAVLCLSTWTYASWTMLAHHTCHGGYNVQQRADRRLSSKRFALGSTLRRARDWLDWMLPEAWNHEHNMLHHYQLGELGDPDLVERNLEFVRVWHGPRALKLVFVFVMAGIWKWAYYSPNTYKQLKLAEFAKQRQQQAQQQGGDGGGKPAAAVPDGVDPHKALTLAGVLIRPHEYNGLFSRTDFLARCLLPMLAGRFLLLPAPLLLLPGGLGPVAYGHAILNLLLADLLSNYHAFVTIVTNHAGDDLYRFPTGCAPNSPTFMLRQVLSSANYRTGGDVNDFAHGWLNYQVEHHIWPTLSMLSYQRAQPELAAICAKHGVPYTQQSVWARLVQTVRIMIGDSSMKEWPGHPQEDQPPTAVTAARAAMPTAA